MPRHTAALYLFAAMMLTGANLPLGKELVRQLPLYLFIFYRFLLCSVTLGFLVRQEPGPRLASMTAAQLRDVILMALFGMLGFSVLILEGLCRTSAIDAGVITATIPAVVVILGVILLREMPNRKQIVAVVLSVLGIGIIQVASATGSPQQSSAVLGNFLIFGAVVGEASFVIFSRRLAPPFQPIRLALAVNLAGLALTLPLAITQLKDFAPFVVPPAVWLWGTWYVLAAGVFTLLLWYRGLPYVDTSLSGIAMTAIPITALVISVLLYGEPIGLSQIAGALLVIVAIWLAARAGDASN